MKRWLFVLALYLALPCACADVRQEIRELREDVRKVRPLLPEPAGVIADGVSMILALFAAKKAQSARRRASRRSPSLELDGTRRT